MTTITTKPTIERESGARDEDPERESIDNVARLSLKLMELQGSRVATIKIQRSINQQANARVRRLLSYHTGLDEKERSAKIKQADAIVKAIERGERGGDVIYECDYGYVLPAAVTFVLAAKTSRQHFDSFRKQIEAEMIEAAEALPAYRFVEPIRGIGALGLAIIYGEAGDLRNYPHHRMLWARFGVAPPEYYMQETKSGKVAFAKPKQRRSALWTIGDCLLKQNKGKYRELYDEWKERESKRTDEGAPQTKMRAHRRAQLVMEKRLLKDIWGAARSES